ncbi:hypothetical protein CP533_6580 [Ophiocordyceps camponoti-saundersi (nom. inval.)]|nr:hypothetical protein CP533_6580 [Ophiocordyceps camponoti-saundersi (nom. inval.)]
MTVSQSAKLEGRMSTGAGLGSLGVASSSCGHNRSPSLLANAVATHRIASSLPPGDTYRIYRLLSSKKINRHCRLGRAAAPPPIVRLRYLDLETPPNHLRDCT